MRLLPQPVILLLIVSYNKLFHPQGLYNTTLRRLRHNRHFQAHPYNTPFPLRRYNTDCLPDPNNRTGLIRPNNKRLRSDPDSMCCRLPPYKPQAPAMRTTVRCFRTVFLLRRFLLFPPVPERRRSHQSKPLDHSHLHSTDCRSHLHSTDCHSHLHSTDCHSHLHSTDCRSHPYSTDYRFHPNSMCCRLPPYKPLAPAMRTAVRCFQTAFLLRRFLLFPSAPERWRSDQSKPPDRFRPHNRPDRFHPYNTDCRSHPNNKDSRFHPYNRPELPAFAPQQLRSDRNTPPDRFRLHNRPDHFHPYNTDCRSHPNNKDFRSHPYNKPKQPAFAPR